MPKISKIAVVQVNFQWTYVRVYTDVAGDWVRPSDGPGFRVELNATVGKKYYLAGSAWFA